MFLSDCAWAQAGTNMRLIKHYSHAFKKQAFWRHGSYGLVNKCFISGTFNVILARIMKLGTLISVKQLGEALAKFPKNLRVLDSSWHPPAAERDPYAEFIEGHIPGALFFDLEECRDKSSKYDHMLPSPSDFEDYVGHLGINNDTHVVVYENDATGFYSSPRAWWNFRVFGHHSVSILNGGFPRWIAEGRPVTKELHSVKKEIFKAQFNEKLVTSLGTVLENKKDEKFQLVDARSANRYNGIEDEPSGKSL